MGTNKIPNKTQLWYFLTILCALISRGSTKHKVISFPDYSKHECIRECDGVPKICRYDFTIEKMFTNEKFHCALCDKHCVLADDRSKLIVVANRQFPGPPIEVCEGDRIVVNVKNDLSDQDTSIHWHGMHQRGTPWMDGVPMITQCPITFHTTFQYDFLAKPSGTHFYHGHVGFQRSMGLQGTLVVKDTKKNNVHSSLYDYDEHVISMTDWFSKVSPELFYYGMERLGVFSQFLLPIAVNGFSDHKNFRCLFKGDLEPKYYVKKGKRYRFRLIHAGAMACSITVSVQDHMLRVIALDGHNVKSFLVQKVTLTVGERVDFVLTADRPGHKGYRITFQGGHQCSLSRKTAMLEYTNKLDMAISFNSDNNKVNEKELNCLNTDTIFDNCVHFKDIVSSDKIPPQIKYGPVVTYYLAFQLLYMMPRFRFSDSSAGFSKTAAINYIANKKPSTNIIDPVAGQEHIETCNFESLGGRGKNLSECVHMIEFPAGVVVELVLYGSFEPIMFHPIHLHGFTFYVLANEKLEGIVSMEDLKARDRKKLLARNLKDPPRKDTIATPLGGYSIIRFLADNPGYWFMHCHIGVHGEGGMALTIKVGDPPKPPQNLPKCGNFFGEH